MNLLGNNSGKLNEVVFENRNKNYGAYAIRQSYNDALAKSLAGLASMLILIFGSAYAYNKSHKIITEEKAITFNDPKLEIREYITEVNNAPLPEPVQKSAAAAAPANAVGTVVSDNEHENTEPVNPDNLLAGTGSATATGVAPVGVESSTTTSAPVVNTTTDAGSAIVVIAEEMPEFEGGAEGLMRYIAQNIVYPSIAREIGIQGIVYVSFVVNETGNVESAKVMKGIGYGCDEEVIRVINKMPRWKKVGKNSGHPVKVRFNVPVAYRLR